MNKSHLLVMVLVGAASAASAQDVRTPAEIAAALRGTNAAAPVVAEGTAESDGSIVLGEERAFSLARAVSKGPAPVAAPRAALARPAVVTATVGRRSTYNPAPAANVRPAARQEATPGVASLDMRLSFATGSSELDSEARRRIDPFATALSQPSFGLAGSTFRVEGHTDSVGSRADNLELSRRRAQAVVDYLVAKGVPATRLTSAGFGPDAPIRGHSARDGANRRVEIVKD